MAEHMLQGAWLRRSRRRPATSWSPPRCCTTSATSPASSAPIRPTTPRTSTTTKRAPRCWRPSSRRVVTECVRLHVAAKRYLCATDPTYFGKLSPASVHTLSLQGGPMSDGGGGGVPQEPVPRRGRARAPLGRGRQGRRHEDARLSATTSRCCSAWWTAISAAVRPDMASRRSPKSVRALEDLGRVRLSENFFMRDFLYSEVANLYGIPNIPDDPDLAIETGRALCENLLEPLREKFGRISIRSAYRCREVARICNERGHNCAKPESEHANHIWDRRDAEGFSGAMATIIVHAFIPYYRARPATGRRWPGGCTTTCPIRRCSSFRNSPPSISAGARSRSGGSSSFIPPRRGVLTKPGMANQCRLARARICRVPALAGSAVEDRGNDGRHAACRQTNGRRRGSSIFSRSTCRSSRRRWPARRASELAAAVSAAGGLGSLPCAMLTPETRARGGRDASAPPPIAASR